MILLSSVYSSHAQSSASGVPSGYGAGFLTSDTTLPRSVRDLREELNRALGDSATNNALMGVQIVSLKTKEVLYARNEHKSLVPASSLKLVSTAAALEYLGPEFTYTTKIFLDGIVKSNGEYVGNVIIRGSGDPSMSTYFMADPMAVFALWARAFDSLGIKSVLGNVIGDNTYFDDAPLGVGWSWDDMPFAFSAQISALSFNDNKVDVIARPSAMVSKQPDVFVLPTTNYVSVLNRVRSVVPDSARGLDHNRAMGANVIDLEGSVAIDTATAHEGKESPRQRSVSVAVENPTLFMLSVFKQALIDRGIGVYGDIFETRQLNNKISYAELRPIASYTSPPLKEIIRITNTISHNLCAEMLLRTLGKEIYGKGSAEKGVQAVRELFRQRGIPTEGMSVVDGSGLSRFNVIAPRHLCSLLVAMYNSKHRAVFMKSLAAPNERGTLQNRLKNTPAANNLRAKTGTMTAVSSLCGYVNSKDQEPIAFALMFNNYTVPTSEIRAIQDFVALKLANFTRKP
jgi:D-alanyl-D-alanine carboxypeptidase/D-alanyl-D-alanine-endopeptidase (penicillin-binding protein 4)